MCSKWFKCVYSKLPKSATDHAGVIDESGEVSLFGGVDDLIGVDAEEVATADAFALVVHLPPLGHVRAYLLTDVLDDHLVLLDTLQREQTPPVDVRPAELDQLFTELNSIHTYTCSKQQVS